ILDVGASCSIEVDTGESAIVTHKDSHNKRHDPEVGED
ncbi:hypothetical protein Tco_0048676, partial [Tanacetum coccineum]